MLSLFKSVQPKNNDYSFAGSICHVKMACGAAVSGAPFSGLRLMDFAPVFIVSKDLLFSENDYFCPLF